MEVIMLIDSVKNLNELESVLQLVYNIFPHLKYEEYRYNFDFWADKLKELPELLLYARDGDVVCGSVFAWDDNGGITVAHCCVDKAYRGKGIGKALMVEIEKRVKDLGYPGITLGSVEGAEEFYEKLGYKGTLLIQSDMHSIDELKSFNKKYQVLHTNVYDGTINQLFLNLPFCDREFQLKYEKAFPGCSSQMIYSKNF